MSYFIDLVLCLQLWFVICYSCDTLSHAKCVFSFSCSELIFSSAGKWLPPLRGQWKYFISHRRGGRVQPSPDISSPLWELWVSDSCTLLPLSRSGQRFLLPACFPPSPLSHGVAGHLSATRRTCIDAPEFSVYYTSKCKVNLAGICVKAVKHRNIKQIAHAEDAA